MKPTTLGHSAGAANNAAVNDPPVEKTGNLSKQILSPLDQRRVKLVDVKTVSKERNQDRIFRFFPIKSESEKGTGQKHNQRNQNRQRRYAFAFRHLKEECR